MKCLLCSSEFQAKYELKDHYITFHKVDQENYFFQKLFKQQQINEIICQKCLRCDDFLTPKFHKNIHNFLKRYVDGKTYI